jgi:asparagine synthase (glutamine-hydrolysing)
MCGIFALLNGLKAGIPKPVVATAFEKGQGRGPEHSSLTTPYPETVFGFHRLAINGLNAGSNQPLEVDNVLLICNGEIYNYRALYESMGMRDGGRTQSDCEVILHLYLRFGIEYTLQVLDGVFAFVLLDRRALEAKLFCARDPFGVRPLYVLERLTSSSDHGDHSGSSSSNSSSSMWGLASELKMLTDIQHHPAQVPQQCSPDNDGCVAHFPPGSYASWTFPEQAVATWRQMGTPVRYHTLGFVQQIEDGKKPDMDNNNMVCEIARRFRDAVWKRCSTTERPIACLLSGGLDSSLVAALVSEYQTTHGLPPVETFSIGLDGSTDLAYARKVAHHLGTTHHEIVVTEQDFVDAVPHVIRDIESYDTTTVRASLGNWMVGKYIREHSEAKVIFNGDGSDELAGGYLYMAFAPHALEFDRECRRLLGDIHAFDVLRSDKCISSHGLEPRTPFLDRGWVTFYLSLPPSVRYRPEAMEKIWIRNAFDGRLPEEVLWRRKEAFSDGVTATTRSLFQILQEHAAALESTTESTPPPPPPPLSDGSAMPTTAEQRWYRRLFDAYYPDAANVVPYFWMPKYVDAQDASARTWIV